MKNHNHVKVIVMIELIMILMMIVNVNGGCPSASIRWSQWSKAPSVANQDLGNLCFSILNYFFHHVVSC